MLSVVSYERKNITFYETYLKLAKHKTFNDVVLIEIFLIIALYQFSKK